MEQIPFGGKRNKILGGGIASDAAMLRRTMRAKEMANDWKTICFLFINSVAVGIRLNKQKKRNKIRVRCVATRVSRRIHQVIRPEWRAHSVSVDSCVCVCGFGRPAAERSNGADWTTLFCQIISIQRRRHQNSSIHHDSTEENE